MRPNMLTAPVGARALDALASLPLLRNGTWLVGTDSHDVTGGNNDGFQASYSYLYKDGDEYVLFEESGPGCIYEIRTIGFKGNLKIYLDGSKKPKLAIPSPDLYSGKEQPFAAPFVAPEETAHGSSWCYVPISYTDGCRITTDEMGPPKFYNIFAHKLAQAEDVAPFDAAISLKDAAALWSDPARYLESHPGLKELRGTLTLAPRAAAALAQIQGEGAILRLKLKFRNGDSDLSADLRLRGFFDEPPAPQVDTPLSTFFALGCPRAILAKQFSIKTEREGVKYISGTVRPQSLLVGEGVGGFLYCNIPMPYWKSAFLELMNTSTRDQVDLEYSIQYATDPYPRDSGYFHAQWRDENPLRPGEDYCVLDARGCGHFLGCVLTMSSHNADSPYLGKFTRQHLEGDARFYVDGIRTPLVASTGTEEYFNWGWYSVLRHDSPFSYPTHGYPLHLIDNEDHSVMYRFHVTDLVPYYRCFRFDLEHGPVGRNVAHYSGTAFYYQREAPRLVLTDELDVCDAGSEKAHAYSCQGALSEHQRILPYEGSYQLPLTQASPIDRPHAVKDSGRVWDRSCRFTATIAPDNNGIKLRRRSYYGFGAQGNLLADRKEPIFTGAQAARVKVDGETVGAWRLPKRHARETWLDTDFEIPAALTRGKDKVTISLLAEKGTSWDDYTYWVYCYVPEAPQSPHRE